VRPNGGRHWRGLRPHDCPSLHRRALTGDDTWLPDIAPGSVHHRRDPPRLHRQLLPLFPPSTHFLETNAGTGSAARNRNRFRRHRHAGIPSVARHERKNPPRQTRSSQNLNYSGGS